MDTITFYKVKYDFDKFSEYQFYSTENVSALEKV